MQDITIQSEYATYLISVSFRLSWKQCSSYSVWWFCVSTAGRGCEGGSRWSNPSPASGWRGRAGCPGDAEERRPPRLHPQPEGTFATLNSMSPPLLVWFTDLYSPFQSDQVSRLVKVHGIIISATPVKAKATKVCLQCRSCRTIIPNISMPPGLEGYALPRKCNRWVGVLIVI